MKKNKIHIIMAFLFIVLILVTTQNLFAKTEIATVVKKELWWPEQKLPAQIVHVSPVNLSQRNLVQSISGLAAKYVNAGTHNELVWTNVSGSAYNYYLTKILQRTTIVDKGNVEIWDIIDQYKTKGIIKGYILYKEEAGNYSVNFATLYASLYDAVLVEESLEGTAISHGLTLKYDARSMNTIASYTQTWFNTIKASLNNKLIVTIAPDDYRQREMAITHGCMVYWGVDDFYNSVLSWMEPNSPVVGWNEGDEGTAIDACSKFGMFTTGATIVNLSILSAGSRQLTAARVKNVNPKLLDFTANKHYLSYVMSDGGNMMIQATSMALSPEYRANADINNLPMSWASCPVNLIQMVPDAWNLFTEQSNPIPGSLTDFNGGLYPDLFATSLGANATSIQRDYAGLVNKKLKTTGIKVFGCLTRDINSDAAKAAYQIYADSIEGLVGIIAIQYVPYNGGGGEVYWVTNKQGIHIPVLTAKYYLHNENSNYSNMGGPVTIANAVNSATSQSAEKTLDWTIVHAWSYYKKDGNGIISDATSTDDGALRGVTPAMWSKSLLNNSEVVSIEELLWRLRMKNYPTETTGVINNYVPDDSIISYPKTLEINFSNFNASTTEMMNSVSPNNWFASSGYLWNSQYCYAQNVTSLPYIGTSIRFGASVLSNIGIATTPLLDLKASAGEEVVLQLSVGCGSTKGGTLEINIDNTTIRRIDAMTDGDSGTNGTTFGSKMYPFEYVIPSESATNKSTITLTQSRSIAAEYIYMNQFKIFRRAKVTKLTQPLSSQIVSKVDRNGTVHIEGLTEDAIVEVYTTLGQLIHKQQVSKDGVFQLKTHLDKILLLRITHNSAISILKVLSLN